MSHQKIQVIWRTKVYKRDAILCIRSMSMPIYGYPKQENDDKPWIL